MRAYWSRLEPEAGDKRAVRAYWSVLGPGAGDKRAERAYWSVLWPGARDKRAAITSISTAGALSSIAFIKLYLLIESKSKNLAARADRGSFLV